MDTITISDLEVFFHVGVTPEERARPQRLLLTVEMSHDCKAAAASDNLGETIDYFAVSQRLARLAGEGQWALIETVAADVAALVLEEFRPKAVSVEVKKFIIPQARHVSVRLRRPA